MRVTVMPTTRRLDGPQSQEAATASLSADVLEALSHACGLVELDALLCHLASSWCALTQSRRVVIGVECRSPLVCRIATANSDGTVTLAEEQRSDEVNLLPQVVAHASCTSGNETTSDAEVEATQIVLQTEHTPVPIGGLLLCGATSCPDDLQKHLRLASAELLTRAVANDRLLQSAKLESLAEFAAGAGHEINNPLAAISGRTQLLLRGESDPERRRHLLTIGAQALRVRDMISDTMLFGRPPQPEPSRLNLTDVVDRVASQFTDEIESQHLTLDGERGSDVTVWADETQLSVVISELLRNAIHASPEGGRITIVTTCETASGGRWARLTMRDEGPGLTDESREHLFDPFYSGRQAGRGLGFGLSKCWRIVTNHGGQIEVAMTDETGFAIVVHWPTNQE